MHKVKFVAVSESCSIDRDTNNLSLFNLMDTLQAPAFPVLMQKMVLSAVIDRTATDEVTGEVEVTIKQSGEPNFVRKLPYSLENGNSGKVVITLNGFVIKEPGIIEFSLKTKNSEMGTTINSVKVGAQI